jgi:hypothetical protein
VIVISFLIGGFIGITTMGIFSARAYEKGFMDGAGYYDED